MEVYLVGGAVRDQLLGLPIHERDWVVVGATPSEMMAAGFTPVGADFPVFLHPKTKEEYALARTERKVGHGYHGFTFYTDTTVTLEEDLLRRDLTVNAMAQAPDGRIIDPYGGQRDIALRTLRHVSPAFREDPVRVLRVARFFSRFKSLGFTIADETMDYMAQQVQSGEIANLVKERVWQEMHRALEEARPEAFFEVLDLIGAWSVLFPMLHKKPDSLQYLVRVCAIEADPLSRWVAWVYGMTLHETVSRDVVKKISLHLNVPKDYREIALLFVTSSSTLLKLLSQPAEEWVLWLEQVDAFRRTLRYHLLVKIAGYLEEIGETAQKLDRVYDVTSARIALPENIDRTEIPSYMHEIRVMRAKEVLEK